MPYFLKLWVFASLLMMCVVQYWVVLKPSNESIRAGMKSGEDRKAEIAEIAGITGILIFAIATFIIVWVPMGFYLVHEVLPQVNFR